MAQFSGIAGDFLNKKALQRRLRAILRIYVASSVMVFTLGYLVAYTWTRRTLWGPVWLVLTGVFIRLTWKHLEKRFNEQLDLAFCEEDGAEGERQLLKFLQDLPDTYTVISDLAFAGSYGNIDHLVIGPKGVFAVDVKNWRGVITPDGHGELLYNGTPSTKPEVQRFDDRVKGLKTRISALTELNPNVRRVFAFPIARVDANWGTTGAVHCIRGRQICDYIINRSRGNPLSTKDISRLVEAVEALRSLRTDAPAVSTNSDA
jgi:nuclease-like protein